MWMALLPITAVSSSGGSTGRTAQSEVEGSGKKAKRCYGKGRREVTAPETYLMPVWARPVMVWRWASG